MGILFKKPKKNRRRDEDRRRSPYNLDYFLKGGRERRTGRRDRRLAPERSVDHWGNSHYLCYVKELSF